MRRALALLFFSLVLVAIAPGCSGDGDPGGTGGSGHPKNVGSIVAGITSDLRVDVDIDQLHVQMWVGDKLTTDEVLTTKSAASKLELPAEFPSAEVAGDTVIKVQ